MAPLATLAATFDLPAWMQAEGIPIMATILGSTWAIVGGVVVAIGLLTAAWKLVGRGAEGIVLFNKKIVPNVQYMDLLPKLDVIHSVLEDLVAQTRRDSGSTLKDDLDLLRKYAQENREAAAEGKRAAAEGKQAATDAKAAVVEATAVQAQFAQATASSLKALEVLVGTIKEHAKDDRDLARKDRDLARDALEEILKLGKSAERTERSGRRVEAANAAVADDLAASQERADDREGEPPGTAADAASQSTKRPQ